MSSVEKEQKRITRREFVKGAAVGAAAAGAGALASCAPPVPQVIKETVEVPVEVTRVVEVEKIVEVPGPPAEAGPVTLEVYDPTGAVEVTELFSTRLDTLEGKTICELSNDGWQYDRTFPAIRELLQKQFPTAKIIPYTEFGRIPNADDVEAMEEQVDKIVAAGCQGVIVGNAG